MMRPYLLPIVTVLILSPMACKAQKKIPENVFSESQTATAQVSADAIEKERGSFVGLAKKVNPAVVNIFTSTKVKMWGGQGQNPFQQRPGDPLGELFQEFFRRYGPPEGEVPDQKSLGSGFVIHAKGYIVTNNHVVANADEIKVKFGEGKGKENEFLAKIVGSDPNSDIALLKIEAKKDLPFLELGDSQALQVGEWVMAVGNPFGLGHTVTVGIISAKGRELGLQKGATYTDFLQTDAAINPGNSGGPLLDTRGSVIGINTAINAAANNIGFAIPSNMVKKILSDLQTKGYVERGWIGVGLGGEVDEKMSEHFKLGSHEGGVIVAQVYPGHPADKAGIRPYDVIVEIDGKKVLSQRDLIQTVGNIPVGKTAEVKYYRDGSLKVTSLKVELRKEDKELAENFGPGSTEENPKARKTDPLGMELVSTQSSRAREMSVPSDVKGLVVVGLKPNGPAQREGLRVGDIITMVNRKPVESMKDYETAIRQSQKTVLIGFLRSGSSLLVVVPKDGEG